MNAQDVPRSAQKHGAQLNAASGREPMERESLWTALTRLGSLAAEENLGQNLGSLLHDADLLSGEIGHLARQVRDAFVTGNGTWHLEAEDLPCAERTNTTGTPDAGQVSLEEGTTDAGGDWRSSWLSELRTLAQTVLQRADSALSTYEIVVRMNRKVRLKTMRQELRSDPRFRYVGDDQWVASKSEPGITVSQSALPPAAATSATSRTNALETAAAMLASAGHPLSSQALLKACGQQITTAALKQELEADPRFHRSERDMWALSEWGMPVYRPIKELIGQMVDENGGLIPSYEVIKKLTRDFGIKESSLKQAMSSPPFTARGGVVRRLGNSAAEVRISRAFQESSKNRDDDGPSADEIMDLMGL